MFHGSLIEIWDPDHVELAEETGGHGVSSSRGWGAGRSEDTVLHIHELQFLQIIETAVIDDLSQQFNGGLGAVGLQYGHVDIIDEDHHFSTGGWTNQIFLLLDEFVFIHEQVLHILGAGLRREVQIGGDKLLGIQLQQEFIHDDGLAHPGLPGGQDIESPANQLIDNEAELLGIGRGDNDIEEGGVAVVDVLGDYVVPVLEFLVFEVDEVVIDVAFEGEGGVDLQDFALNELGVFGTGVEGLSIIEVSSD